MWGVIRLFLARPPERKAFSEVRLDELRYSPPPMVGFMVVVLDFSPFLDM